MDGILSLLTAKRSRSCGIEGWLIVLRICKSGIMKTLHPRNLSWPRAASVAFALLCLAMGFAPFGNAASAGPRSWPASSAQVTSQFAIADFDGDSRPDLATVQVGQNDSWNTRYWIAFQLSTGSRQTLGITAPTGGLQIASRDVNGDDFVDVVVTTSWTNRPVAVLLNDGRGNFTPSDPSAFPGAFETSERSWTYTTDEIRDASAALSLRYLSGDYEEGDRAFSPPNKTRLPISSSSQFAALSTIVSSFGRAPPSYSPHL